jgi:CDP-diacylglycerol pyrophosphatase
VGNRYAQLFHWLTILSLVNTFVSGQASGSYGRLALWHMVHDECRVNAEKGANPSPCLMYRSKGADDKSGYAIVKDRVGESQFLLIPTYRLSGIGDPQLLANDAPNYFAEAWDARFLVSGMREREISREYLSLAVNSEDNVSQDQLHIHIDCVREDIVPILRRLKFAASKSASAWQDVTLGGRRYRVTWIAGDKLEVNPFKLLSSSIPQPEMRHHSLVVIGSRHPALGLFVLDTSGNRAHGEDLQSHQACVK